MNTSVMVVIFFIVIALVVLFGALRVRKKAWQQYKATLPYIVELKSLITLIQKHRAMCAAYLQGDATSLQAKETLSSKIRPINKALNDSPIVYQHQRWLGYIDHWSRLQSHVLKLSVEKSFEQHSELVANLLYLMEDIAENQGFDRTKFKDTKHISILWRELPSTVEYIGQSRALGVAVTTAGVVTQVDKVKLGYLETKISHSAREVLSQIKPSGYSKPEQQHFVRLAVEACQQFTLLIRKELLTSERLSITSSDYFTAATQAMESILQLLDNELQELDLYIKSQN